MIKVEMVDPEDLACANPHDIFQVYPEAPLMHLNILVSSSQLQDQDSFDATVYSAKSECPTPVGDCYDSSLTDSTDLCSDNGHFLPTVLPQPRPIDTTTQHRSQSANGIGRTDIRMEEFQDLDAVLSDPGLESTTAEYELNTPVFEKSNPFDVDLAAPVRSLSQSSIISQQQQQSTSSSYMFNYVIKEEPISSSDRCSSLYDNVTEPTYTINVTNNNSIFGEAAVSSFLWPCALKSKPATSIGDDNSGNSVNKIDDELDEFIIQARDSYEEEEFNHVYKRECLSSGSSECSVDAANSVPPRLIMPDGGAIQNFFANNAVNTPDIITTIEEIEAEHKAHSSDDDFNILQFISEQDIATSSNIIESLELPPSSSTRVLQTSSHPTTSFSTNTNYQGRSRTDSQTSKSSSCTSTISKSSSRRKRINNPSYDDDEEYLPPIKRPARLTQRPKTLTEYESDLSSSDSEESSVQYSKSKSKTNTNASPLNRRGRPLGSKQSSTSYTAPGDKYREMRDKNNEASRKSRLKKKQQDTHYFVEMDDLELRNRQLKARVSELQKTVDTFRNNLMKVMLKSK